MNSIIKLELLLLLVYNYYKLEKDQKKYSLSLRSKRYLEVSKEVMCLQ
jgi:hypothetical protein